jgi:hypothetical protein
VASCAAVKLETVFWCSHWTCAAAAAAAALQSWGLDVAMTAPEVISQARQDLKLEDIELPIAEDARRLVAALRTGTGAYLPAGGAAAGSSSGYTMGRVSTRPLR